MDQINDMLRRKILRGLFGKDDQEFSNGSVSTNATSTAGNVYDSVMEALNKVKGLQPKTKTTYCSWNFFVKLLEVSNLTITAGHTVNGKSWYFELDGYAQVWVSDIIPTDDTGFQFKDEPLRYR